MACRILRGCISCGICINLCANHAIFVDENDAFAIDPARCTECIDLPRRRCYSICTVDAIQRDPGRREAPDRLWEKHRALRLAPAE